MNIDAFAAIKLDHLREEITQEYGPHVASITAAAMTAAMQSLARNSYMKEVDLLVCLNAFIKVVKAIDRLSDEHAEQVKNAKNN